MGNKLLKYLYRIIILLIIFVASIFYFSRNIKEVVFDIDNTTVMEETTFPLVTIRSGDSVINLLHGYSTNLDANAFRESLTPIGEDQSFEVIFDQEKYDIKKMNYEVRDFKENELIEADSISVFEEDGSKKAAKVKLMSELAKDQEYAVKLTLITSESEKIYFYHRVKRMDQVYLKEKLEFVMGFHNAIREKNKADWVIDRLEPDKNQDNTSLARVDIHSSYDLITWGALQPKLLTEVIPTIMEINSDFASIELQYVIEADISGNSELFQVKEFYRVQYTPGQVYLIDYQRNMEALFNTDLISVVKSQLKLGITSDMEVPYLASADKMKLAFIRNRELWFYDLESNEMVRVFSFRQKKSDYIRDLYDQHDIRILNMDAEGNVNFIVYGYMNRGQYEGRVAVILYEYIRAEDRIEEKVYIPVDEPFQSLRENLGTFAYVNSLDVFYFHLYNSLYSYDLITGQINELAKGVDIKKVVDLKDQGYVAWQSNPDPKLSKEIKIMELETGEFKTINAETGYQIQLMDSIDSNIIYGFTKKEDITSFIDGRLIVPMKTIEIASLDKNVLKSYSKKGYYITNLRVKDNIIELDRVKREKNNEYQQFIPATKDYIMNRITSTAPFIKVTTRVTEEAMTEAYLSLPEDFTMKAAPKIKSTVNTVISQDPTLRPPKQENNKLLYYPYVNGDVKGEFEEAADAIAAAGEGISVVLNNHNQLVWERGVKKSKNTITGYEGEDLTITDQSIAGCIQLLAKHLGKTISNNKAALNGRSILEVLEDNIENTPVRLTGISLEDALYYVSAGRPVIAMKNNQDAVLIYGYDTFNISVIDPKQGTTMKIGLQDSREMFNEAGNVFISYLE